MCTFTVTEYERIVIFVSKIPCIAIWVNLIYKKFTNYICKYVYVCIKCIGVTCKTSQLPIVVHGTHYIYK